jgi:hypothetical protein
VLSKRIFDLADFSRIELTFVNDLISKILIVLGASWRDERCQMSSVVICWFSAKIYRKTFMLGLTTDSRKSGGFG